MAVFNALVSLSILAILALLCFTLFKLRSLDGALQDLRDSVHDLRVSVHELRGSLQDLKVRLSEKVASSQTAFEMERLLKKVAAGIEEIKVPRHRRRDDQTGDASTFEGLPLEESLPEGWQEPRYQSFGIPVERRRDRVGSQELPFDQYCQSEMPLEQLTGRASRAGLPWGSFVRRDSRDKQYEFVNGNDANKLIGFRRPGRSDEFTLVLAKGAIWDVDFLQFFEMREDAMRGDAIATETPAHVRLRDGVLEAVTKGVMKRA